MAIPYQPSYQIQPTHGFRYGAQPHANNVAPTYEVPAYEAPPSIDSSPTKNKTLDNNKSVVSNFEGNEDRDNSALSNQLSLDAAQSVQPRNYDAEEKGIFNQGQVYSPEFSLGALMPLGMGSGPVSPTTGFGSKGSISGNTGGIFDEKGRSYDSITGAYNPEFANAASFRSYMMTDPLGTKENPLPNILGDRDNAFKYERDKTGKRTNTSASGFEFAMANSPLNEGGLTEAEKNLIAKKVGVDQGIAESSLENDGPTIKAIRGEGYIDGVAPKGSQFSSTGKFSTEKRNLNDLVGSTTNNSSYNSDEDSSYETSGYSSSIDTGGFSRGGRVGYLSQGGLVQAGGK